MVKDFRQHFLMFTKKLQIGENFAFNRFSDGELWILQNKERKIAADGLILGDTKTPGWDNAPDFKHFIPNEHSFYRDKLIESFKHKQPNYYKAIWPFCCSGEEHYNYYIDLHGSDDDSLTFSTLWMYSNYPLFMKHIYPILENRKCVFVGHESADLTDTPFFVKDFRVGYNAFINDYSKIEDIKKWVGENNIENHIFIFSASTFSNVSIHQLYEQFPNNTYIDVGTAISPIIKVKHGRGVQDAYWKGLQDERIPNILEKVCTWKPTD